MAGRRWSESELLIALKIYFELEFGQFHQHQPRIIEIAKFLARTPSALAMKLCNFASLDPAMNGKGLSGASKADRDLMTAFVANPERVIAKVEHAFDHLFDHHKRDFPQRDFPKNADLPNSNQFAERATPFMGQVPDVTEGTAQRKTRIGQSFFRTAVLSGYRHQCGVCALKIPDLLVASHIIPWRENAAIRLRPDNGIALCAIHDKAFDLGFWSLNSQLKIILSPRLSQLSTEASRLYFDKFSGETLILPDRFAPKAEFIEWHRNNVFLDAKP